MMPTFQSICVNFLRGVVAVYMQMESMALKVLQLMTFFKDSGFRLSANSAGNVLFVSELFFTIDC